jgi:hypothetical protein
MSSRDVPDWRRTFTYHNYCRGMVFSWAMALVLCEWGFHRFLEAPVRSFPSGPMTAGRAKVSSRVTISSILAVFAVPGLVDSLYAGTCFGTYGVRTRGGFFSEERIFPWADVRKISIGCNEHRRPATRLSDKLSRTFENPWIKLTMIDATVFLISPRPYPSRDWQNIGESLQLARFIYDRSATSQCSPEDQRFLDYTFGRRESF